MKKEHDHAHCQGHDHSPHEEPHGTNELDRKIKGRLRLSIALTGIIFIAELLGGYLTNSLALMSDAVHVFMDVLALSLSWFAIYIAEMPPTDRRTYGFHRVEVLVSFANSFLLFLIMIFIFYEAYGRLVDPQPVKAEGMLWVAAVGLAVNLIVAMWLKHFAHSDLNVRSAFIHVLGDAAASVGVIAGAVIIHYTGWYMADPIISFVIGLIVVWGALQIMMESSHILLEGVPKDIDLNEVRDDLLAAKGVSSVHSLHIWSICHNVYALSAHLDISPVERWRMGEIYDEINGKLAEKHHIFYTTLQAECSGCDRNDVFGKIAHKERNHNHLH